MSAALYVPSSLLSIYAIKCAGLSIAQGVWLGGGTLMCNFIKVMFIFIMFIGSLTP